MEDTESFEWRPIPGGTRTPSPKSMQNTGPSDCSHTNPTHGLLLAHLHCFLASLDGSPSAAWKPWASQALKFLFVLPGEEFWGHTSRYGGFAFLVKDDDATEEEDSQAVFFDIAG